MNRKPQEQAGFTLVEIMIVVAIIGLLLAIAVPNFIKTRALATSRACINNLKQMESAKQVWGVENGKAAADTPVVSDLVGPLLYLKQMPLCPGGGTYTLNSIATQPTCTITDHSL